MESNQDNITSFIHCGRCLEEWNKNEEIKTKVSPKDYSKISCGFTKQGLQIWCNRHNCNIMHIDFEGEKHPADLTIHKEEF